MASILPQLARRCSSQSTYMRTLGRQQTLRTGPQLQSLKNLHMCEWKQARQCTSMSHTVSSKGEIYKHYPDLGFTVRRMAESDIAAVMDMWRPEYPMSRTDLDICMRIFPKTRHGFYVGECKGELMLSIVTIPWTNTLLYGGMMMVREPYRRKGFAALTRNDVIYRLHLPVDAVLTGDAFAGEEWIPKMYENNDGFKRRWSAAGFEGVANLIESSTKAFSIVPVSELDFLEFIRYDDRCFVTPANEYRHQFLKHWIDIQGGSAIAAVATDGSIVGYGCRRPGDEPNYHKIGPLYADDIDVATELMNALCEDVLGQTILVEVQLPNDDAVKLMSKHFRLSKRFKFERVARAGEIEGPNKRVYAMTSTLVCGF